MRRAAIVLLTSFLMFMCIAEFALRGDPLGVKRLHDDLAILSSITMPHPTRTMLYRPGTLQFSNWSMTILPDYSRRVPDTSATSSCTIVLLGDSVTLSWGVDDDKTWANLVAQQLPGVRLINTGVSAYSIYEIEATMKAVAGQGYLYLLIDNDNLHPDYKNAPLKPTEQRSAIQMNLEYLTAASQPYPPGDGKFYTTLEGMLNNGSVLIVAFNLGSLSKDVAARYPDRVHLIPFYKSRISKADGHADAQGNREIAQAILPHVETLANRVCRSTRQPAAITPQMWKG